MSPIFPKTSPAFRSRHGLLAPADVEQVFGLLLLPAPLVSFAACGLAWGSSGAQYAKPQAANETRGRAEQDGSSPEGRGEQDIAREDKTEPAERTSRDVRPSRSALAFGSAAAGGVHRAMVRPESAHGGARRQPGCRPGDTGAGSDPRGTIPRPGPDLRQLTRWSPRRQRAHLHARVRARLDTERPVPDALGPDQLRPGLDAVLSRRRRP